MKKATTILLTPTARQLLDKLVEQTREKTGSATNSSVVETLIRKADHE